MIDTSPYEVLLQNISISLKGKGINIDNLPQTLLEQNDTVILHDLMACQVDINNEQSLKNIILGLCMAYDLIHKDDITLAKFMAIITSIKRITACRSSMLSNINTFKISGLEEVLNGVLEETSE